MVFACPARHTIALLLYMGGRVDFKVTRTSQASWWIPSMADRGGRYIGTNRVCLDEIRPSSSGLATGVDLFATHIFK